MLVFFSAGWVVSVWWANLDSLAQGWARMFEFHWEKTQTSELNHKRFLPRSHPQTWRHRWELSVTPERLRFTLRVKNKSEAPSPRTEVRLQAAEAHHRDLQARGSAVISRRPGGPRRQQRGTQRGAQRGAKASAEFAHGSHLGERGVLGLGPWTLFIFLDWRKLLNDASIYFTVCLWIQRQTETEKGFKQPLYFNPTSTFWDTEHCLTFMNTWHCDCALVSYI